VNTVGPISLTIDVPVTEVDPAQGLGNSSATVQVQNSSAFVLMVLAGGDVFTIQPFFATTIPVTGTPIVITPSQNPQNTSGNTITLVWLLQGEQPPMEDGPLNLPLSTIEQLINAGLNTGVGSLLESTAGLYPLVPAVPGFKVILGSLFLQPGLSSGTTQMAVTGVIGGVSTYLCLQYAGTAPQPGVAVEYPQGVAFDTDNSVDFQVGPDLTQEGLAVVTYVLAPG
jgi:hypothetical protein